MREDKWIEDELPSQYENVLKWRWKFHVELRIKNLY